MIRITLKDVLVNGFLKIFKIVRYFNKEFI